MGYGFYFVSAGNGNGRDRAGGYNVLATCDKKGCDNEIDRGLGHLCGEEPHDLFSDAPGCGRYFCGKHLGGIGPRGGCSHRRARWAYGETLSCLARKQEGTVAIYCTTRVGHDSPHWEEEE